MYFDKKQQLKRLKLKRIIVILALSLVFVLYLLACFPVLNSTVFAWDNNKEIRVNVLQSTGDSGDAGSKNSSDKISNGDGVDSSKPDNNKNNTVNDKGAAKDTGNDNTVRSTGIISGNEILTFDFKNPVNPEISDYILVSITAKNTGQVKYPYGSIAVNLSREKTSTSDDTGFYVLQERTRIFVDGLEHTYYIPVGENKYYSYDWNLEGTLLKKQVSSLELEIPAVDGVDIQINSISLNKRPFFAADSHINYFFKSYFQLSYIDRFLTPAYIFLILFTVVFFLLWVLLKKAGGNIERIKSGELKTYGKTEGELHSGVTTIELHDDELNDAGVRAGNITAADVYTDTKNQNEKIAVKNIKSDNFKILFRNLPILIPSLLLIFFSFYFIGNYIFTVKGYWDSYKQYAISGRLDETYYGFSDFKKFVTWVGQKVPEDKNIIVLVKGQPIYIMAQMAYGLYPRDIKFIDINKMSAGETAEKIIEINSGSNTSNGSFKITNTEAAENSINTIDSAVSLNNNSRPGDYGYIVILSETDKKMLEDVKVKLEYNYRQNAGFIYKLILK